MIVVGIDGSEGAGRALRFAAGEASLRGTDLRIVAVWNIPAAFYASEAMAPAIPVDRFEGSMRAAAVRQVDDCLAEYGNLKRHLIVTEGAPPQVLVKAGAGPEELEPAIRAVLEADPHNAQARHNLEVLLRTTGRWVEGVIDAPPGPG